MDFDQLKYFVSVAQSRSFTAAAKRHHISQSAISRRVTELEKEIGTRLLIRDSHSVDFSDAGREFYEYAVSVLDMTDINLRRLDNISKGRIGRIRISSVPTSAHTLRRAIAQFHKLYPMIQIDLEYCVGKEQIVSISQGKHDFYFSFLDLLEAQDNLQCMTTDYDRFELYVPSDYAHLVNVQDFSSLNNIQLLSESLSQGPFLVSKILDICRSRGFDTDNTMFMGNLNSIADLANAGLGFTIIPHTMCRSICTDHLVAFTIPGEDAVLANAMGWPKGKLNSSSVKFLEVCRSMFSKPERFNG